MKVEEILKTINWPENKRINSDPKSWRFLSRLSAMLGGRTRPLKYRSEIQMVYANSTIGFAHVWLSIFQYKGDNDSDETTGYEKRIVDGSY
jgi:hypothetical protein